MTDSTIPSPVEMAIADLATTLGIEPSVIEVESYEQVTWRDGSLGCPVEGRAYTQALVDGYRLVLAADGETYHYHGAVGSAPFLCEDPQAPMEEPADA